MSSFESSVAKMGMADCGIIDMEDTTSYFYDCHYRHHCYHDSDYHYYHRYKTSELVLMVSGPAVRGCSCRFR